MAKKTPTGEPDGPITNPDEWTRTTMNIRRDLLKSVKMKVLENDTTITNVVTDFLIQYIKKG